MEKSQSLAKSWAITQKYGEKEYRFGAEGGGDEKIKLKNRDLLFFDFLFDDIHIGLIERRAKNISRVG